MDLFAKIINGFHSLTIFLKMIHHRCLNFSLQLYKNRSHPWIFLQVFAYFPGTSILRNAFNLQWTIIFELKSRFYAIQIQHSQNDNKISNRTIVELNLRSYVHFVVIYKSSQFCFLSAKTTYMYVMLTWQIFFPDIKLKYHSIISGRLISLMTAR